MCQPCIPLGEHYQKRDRLRLIVDYRKKYETLQLEIISVIESLNQLRESPDYELCQLSGQKAGVLDELAIGTGQAAGSGKRRTGAAGGTAGGGNQGVERGGGGTDCVAAGIEPDRRPALPKHRTSTLNLQHSTMETGATPVLRQELHPVKTLGDGNGRGVGEIQAELQRPGQIRGAGQIAPGIQQRVSVNDLIAVSRHGAPIQSAGRRELRPRSKS